MEREQFVSLVQKVSDGMASDQEIALYNRYFNEFQKAGSEWDAEEMGPKDAVFMRLTEQLNRHIKPAVVVSFWSRSRQVAAAAVLFVGLLTAVLYGIYGGAPGNDPYGFAKTDLPPGGNKAVLTLSNGKQIVLNGSGNGVLNSEKGMSILKTKDGQLVYTIADGEDRYDHGLNTIQTPNGGQYQVNLPDGTRVWLNAASSIRFPAVFGKLKPRTVELTGEAYFEVAHRTTQAFIVRTAGQEVKVLGTHFNVNSYNNEPSTTTTLLEGSVQVSSGGKEALLAPGEQSAVSTAGIRKQEVDVSSAIDWKNGEFAFRNAELSTIMRKIARWYDVEVIFMDDQIGHETFGGSVSKYGKVSEVLTTLALTEKVHFRMEGRKIFVMK
ncbi:putative anti-sigma factor [Pedobacter sp. BAL39]|uniref:FecR family protein n=1 Tax=Pedobacter sp. BAL39 TaxID=391596 RepID=UPI000155AC72|nr:FecR family protein [Pedobacter sp. BAL39]EDM34152.1 putative anti-sigma factor [Pedobacter sp. BAL39]